MANIHVSGKIEVFIDMDVIRTQRHIVNTNDAAAYGDLGNTRAVLQGNVLRLLVRNQIPSVLAHIGHFAAAIHRTVDSGGNVWIGLRNLNFSVFGHGDKQDRCFGMMGARGSYDTRLVALATTIHVAHAVGGEVLDECLVAHLAACHLHFDISEFLAVFTFFVGDDVAIEVDTRQGKTATAKDGAIDLAAAHFDGDVATHAACVVVGLAVVASAAKDVAVVARGASGAHETTDIISMGIAKHVAVFGAAEDAAPNAVGVGIG